MSSHYIFAVTNIKFMRGNKNIKGFTLLELLIVVTIMAIISGITVLNYDSVVLRSKLKTDYASSKVILSAIKLYELDNGKISDNANIITLLGAEYLSDAETVPALGGEWSYSDKKVIIIDADDLDVTSLNSAKDLELLAYLGLQ